MISALAEAGAAGARRLHRRRRGHGRVPARPLRDDQGRLLRTWKDGQARLNAYLEDHAFLRRGAALLTLYESSFDPRWFAEARVPCRHHDRALRRRRARRLLRDLIGPRAAARPPQGPRGPPDPVREAGARPTACCGSRRSRASSATSNGRSACCGCCTSWRPGTRRPRTPAPGARLPPRPRSRRSPLEATTWSRWSASCGAPSASAPVAAGGAADGVPLLRPPPVDGRPAAYVCERFPARRR